MKRRDERAVEASLPRRFRRRLRDRLFPRNVTISAVITRADGTVEDLGVISKGKVRFIPEAKS